MAPAIPVHQQLAAAPTQGRAMNRARQLERALEQFRARIETNRSARRWRLRSPCAVRAGRTRPHRGSASPAAAWPSARPPPPRAAFFAPRPAATASSDDGTGSATPEVGARRPSAGGAVMSSCVRVRPVWPRAGVATSKRPGGRARHRQTTLGLARQTARSRAAHRRESLRATTPRRSVVEFRQARCGGLEPHGP
jgi:hypothetical protein